jgi:hypothetical protein
VNVTDGSDERGPVDPPRGTSTPVDATAPSNPRIYDYLLGGRDNFEADRQMAEALQAQAQGGTGVRELAGINRRFVLRATTWAASMLGIGQFIDCGCGLPSSPAIHDAARDGCPEARVVYADRDPMVISHAAALMTGTGLAAVMADVSVPARVLGLVADLEVPGAGPLIDFARPAACIFGGTLSGMDADTARTAVAGYAEALAPGSCVIVSCTSYLDQEHAARMAALFAPAGTWLNHGLEDVASFFGGLRIVRGRAGNVKCWPMLPAETPDACVLGGIGIKD